MSVEQNDPHPQVRQKIEAGRDAYVAGGNQLIVNLGTDLRRQEWPQRRVFRNIPARNPGFTGREELLSAVRDALVSGDRAVVQALHGIGGVGKTQLAAEYAHQFADEYDVMWWVAAERASLVGDQFAALGAEFGCTEPGAPLAVLQRAVLSELRNRGKWLLIFDNAEKAEDIAPWLPGSGGHVLITSRARGWDEVAVPVEVDVLARAESASVLLSRVRGLSQADAELVAAAVGDLPLAVVQAAEVLAGGMPARQYVRLLKDRAAEILAKGGPPFYHQGSLAAATFIALDHLRDKDAMACDLAVLCAFLAPEPIPADWFAHAANDLPTALAQRTADPLAWQQMLTIFRDSALVRTGHDGLVLHRLVQAIITSQLTTGHKDDMRRLVIAVLAANHAGDTTEPGNWPAWARMLPHLLALDPAETDSKILKDLAVSATWYMTRRGNATGGHDIARRLYDRWLARFGPDESFTLRVANALAGALRELGRFVEAHDIDADTLARRRNLAGHDDRETLMSAQNLGIDLRELRDVRAALELDQDTLRRRRALLGDDHPETLSSANNLAIDLFDLKQVEAARQLNEDTLARRQRVLGPDHPETLNSASNLANTLFESGQPQAARELDEDVLARRRQVLGEDHPMTLLSAINLVEDLRALQVYSPPDDLDAKTLERCHRVLGEDHPYTLAMAGSFAANLLGRGNYQAAADLGAGTLARFGRAFGNDDPRTQEVARNLEEAIRLLGSGEP